MLDPVSEAIATMHLRVERTMASIGESFPHYADTESGLWTVTPNGDWTGGHWVGMLWLTHHRTKEPRYLEAAEAWMERLRPRLASETVFRGFLFWYGAAMGSALCGSAAAQSLAIDGARSLAGLYNPVARAIPLGSEAEEASSVGRGETNVDCVVACALLVWASEETGDDALRQIGINHALTHIDWCIRSDGSVCQSARFNPETGEVISRYTHKGYTDNSTWARAQSWAMLGYAAAAARVPDEPEFLRVAQATARWWIGRVPDDWVAYWDFDAPRTPETKRDTAATAIAAAALLKLATLVDGDGARHYHEAGARTVAALVERYLTPTHGDDRRSPGMLTGGCYNQRIDLATDNELIWGDYYLYEALHVLRAGLDPLIV